MGKVQREFHTFGKRLQGRLSAVGLMKVASFLLFVALAVVSQFGISWILDPRKAWDDAYRATFAPYAPTPWGGYCLLLLWPLPPLLYWLIQTISHPPQREVSKLDQSELLASDLLQPVLLQHTQPRKSILPLFRDEVSEHESPEHESTTDLTNVRILYASLEHKLPKLKAAKAVAGGLGKVTELVSRTHPMPLIMVTAKLGQESDYAGPGILPEPPVNVVVDGEAMSVLVESYDYQNQEGSMIRCVMLSHPLFAERDRESIYPNPMSRRRVLQFFSLWNQAVAELLVRYNVGVYHCPDFHTAVAQWYAVERLPNLKMLLVMHNAEYQGQIMSDMLTGDKIDEMAEIWNVEASFIEAHMMMQGRFLMLKCASDFIMKYQSGEGTCAVSKFYAQEITERYQVFSHLSCVRGLDNPMLEDERPEMPPGHSLADCKAKCKREIQEQFGLNPDPDAVLFVFLGRLVKQKGVDLIADITPWMLDKHPKAQLVCIGPVADGFGHYSKAKFDNLMQKESYKGRLFAKCEFIAVRNNLKFGADYCLMPSRDEPFGYVDIEFAWHGAIMCGAQAGGLGKVPGYYYIAQNRESLSHLEDSLKHVLNMAMFAAPEQRLAMAETAMRSKFPLAVWQRELLKCYQRVLDTGNGGSSNGMASALPALPSLPTPDFPDDVSSSATSSIPGLSLVDEIARTGALKDHSKNTDEFLIQELSTDELANLVKNKVAEHPQMNIEDVLQSVGADVDKQREEQPMSRFLLSEICGIQLVSVIVSLGYLTTPIASFLSGIVVKECINRRLPENVENIYLGEYYPAPTFRGQEVDMSHVTFSLYQISYAVGLLMWACLARCIQPRILMGVNMVLKLFYALLIIPVTPSIWFMCVVMIVDGLITSGSLLFVVFNFMTSIKVDLAKVAVRFGALEAARLALDWWLLAYVYTVQPSAIQGNEGLAYTWTVTQTYLVLVGILVLFCVLPGVLMFWAPGPFREDRFPGWSLWQIWDKGSFVYLSLSDVVGRLALYPAMMYTVWWNANRWDMDTLRWIALGAGLVALLVVGLWALSISLSARYNMNLLCGFALLCFPPAMIYGIAFQEVSTITWYGKSTGAMIISLVALTYQLIHNTSVFTARVYIANSRWQVLSYFTIFGIMGHALASLSPWISQFMIANWSKPKLSFLAHDQGTLAEAVMMCVVPIQLFQYAIQVLATPFIRRDLQLPTNSLRGGPWGWKRFCRSWSSFMTLGMAISLVFCVTFLFKFRQHHVIQPDMDRVGRCRGELNVPLTSLDTASCDVVYDVEDGALAVPGFHYGPNEHGWNTTGKANCLEQLWRHKDKGANTFMYYPGSRCVVYRCVETAGSTSAATSASAPEVWSYQCPWAGVEVMAMHMFSWRWVDIARECENYLGPTGVNVIQIQPPQESIRGDSWFIVYQPTSYKLDSKLGTEAELIDMVKRCNKAGVSVMVDAVINHMAPTQLSNTFDIRAKNKKLRQAKKDVHECGPDGEIPCLGVAGTTFSARNFDLDPQLDGFKNSRGHFHTLPWSSSNCRWDFNDDIAGYMCDMNALPDLDSENLEVQYMQRAYLAKLYAIGITMMRVDAGRSILPESQARIFSGVPWDYLVTEWINDWKDTPEMLKTAAVTDINYGKYLGGHLFPQCESLGKCYDTRKKTPEEIAADKAAGIRVISFANVSESPCAPCGDCELTLAGPTNDEGTCNQTSYVPYDYNRTADPPEDEDWCRKHPNYQFFSGSESPCAPYQCCEVIGGWKTNVANFSNWMKMGISEYTDNYAPPNKSLVFIDNHDTQRWGVYGGLNGTIWNWYDHKPMHKHGNWYRIAMLFSLAWPYGDALRLISSYGFPDTYPENHHIGPPGFAKNTLDSEIESPFADASEVEPSFCSEQPNSIPVSEEWQSQMVQRWICEHRWEGVPGFIRLRRELRRQGITTVKSVIGKWSDDTVGHISFSLKVDPTQTADPAKAFFAFNRGVSSVVEAEILGQEGKTFTLAGHDTGMAEGYYCNMATMTEAVPAPEAWRERMCRSVVHIAADGRLTNGSVPEGSAFAIHESYRGVSPHSRRLQSLLSSRRHADVMQ